MTTLTLSAPLIITPRLLPGVQVTNHPHAMYVSAELTGTDPDGRWHFSVHVDVPGHSDALCVPVSVPWRGKAERQYVEAVWVVLDTLSDEDQAGTWHEALERALVRGGRWESSALAETLREALDTAQ